MYIPDGKEIAKDDAEYDPSKTYIAIGWLGKYGPFPTGDVPEGFVVLLTEQVFTHHRAQMRGFHYCERCSVEQPVVRHGSREWHLGSAEIWIPKDEQTVFAAPNLIVHYVSEHRYLPPQEFIDAVMRHPKPPATSEEKFLAELDGMVGDGG